MYNEKMMKRIDKVDFYGDKDNYIHLKFGDLRKCYNFTNSFMKKYPKFVEEYIKYFNCEESLFTDSLSIVNYIRRCNIPVYLYFNFTDKVCKNWEEIYMWLGDNYFGKKELYNYYQKNCYIDLDGHEIEDK